jgi:maleylacetate reductase
MVAPFVHDVPASRVVFAPGAIEQVPSEVDRLGAHRVLLISGGPESVYADALAEKLGPRLAGRFTDVVMHVPIATAQAAVAAAESVSADLVVALGGGSAIGAAKAIAKEIHLPILAVPTTYAGSEMTNIWGLTDGQLKTTGRDPHVLPKTVVYDPELTLSLPVNISAASGMNALAHLVEGLYAPDVSPITMLQAQEGIRAIASALPRIVVNPDDIEARSDALYGAWLAGWTLGTTAMGVHHKICHTLGGTFDLPHAPTHSAVIAYATAFNEEFAPQAMTAIKDALAEAGIVAPTAAAGIWELADRIGAPTSLADVGFSEADIDRAADIVATAQPTNPRPIDSDGIRALLHAAHDGTRPGASVS